VLRAVWLLNRTALATGTVPILEIVPMVASVTTPSRSFHPDDFLPLMTVVQKQASVVFRSLPAVEREEAIAEAVAAAYVSCRLCDQEGAQT
jgi:hypothetical protein